MDKRINSKQGPINGTDNSSEVNLMGFDNLWDIGSEDTRKFIELKQSQSQPNTEAELEFLTKELDEKNFELQKLHWQLTEREKELKNSYDELHKLLELNKRLNQQLADFEKLTARQEALIEMLSQDPDAYLEPKLPNFG
jgi:chromosome segregation ATPase